MNSRQPKQIGASTMPHRVRRGRSLPGMREVVIERDGACSGTPGRGGWGVVLQWNGTVKELYGGEPQTTNNRMELMAAIQALEALNRPSRVQREPGAGGLGRGAPVERDGEGAARRRAADHEQ